MLHNTWSRGSGRRLLAWAAALALALLPLAGCGGGAGGARTGAGAPAGNGVGSGANPAAPDSGGAALAPLSPPAKVTVGMKGVPSDAGVLVGVAKGYFQELGIEVEAQDFKTGQDMIQALAAGHLDVALTVTSAGLFNAILRGVDIKIVADKGHNLPGRGYYRLVLRPEVARQVRDYRDLKGKRLAVVGAGSLDEIALDRVLARGGLSTRDVDLKVLPSFPDIVAALGSGAIDGGMLIEPFVTQAVDRRVGDPWKDPAEYDGNAQVAIVVYGVSMTRRPELAERFLVAYLKGVRDYHRALVLGQGRDEMVRLLARTSTVKDEALLARVQPAGLNPDGYVGVAGVQADIDWYVQRQLLKGHLTAERAVDHRYVEAALRVLGSYR